MKINLKYHPQYKDYTCGPACLRMVFEHLGKKYSEEEIARLCYANKRYGTSHKHLIGAIKNEKFTHYSKNKGILQDLIECVDTGYLAIINYIDPSSESGHYAVVTGYTDDKKEVILADPNNGNDFIISWNKLKKRWQNHNNTSRGWFVAVDRNSVNC